MQQSHHCGIETGVGVEATQVKNGSNRTIVGLKLDAYKVGADAIEKQQSHHCGIETSIKGAGQPHRQVQQSHHCGIETCHSKKSAAALTSSNRTIVGLKHLRQVQTGLLSFAQQSHHCGIETSSG